VATGGEVTHRELLRMDLISLTESQRLWGNVVTQISEMGFAVRFVFWNLKRTRNRSSAESFVYAVTEVCTTFGLR